MPDKSVSEFDLFLQQLDQNKQKLDHLDQLAQANQHDARQRVNDFTADHDQDEIAGHEQGIIHSQLYPIQQPLQASTLDSFLEFDQSQFQQQLSQQQQQQQNTPQFPQQQQQPIIQIPQPTYTTSANTFYDYFSQPPHSLSSDISIVQPSRISTLNTRNWNVSTNFQVQGSEPAQTTTNSYMHFSQYQQYPDSNLQQTFNQVATQQQQQQQQSTSILSDIDSNKFFQPNHTFSIPHPPSLPLGPEIKIEDTDLDLSTTPHITTTTSSSSINKINSHTNIPMTMQMGMSIPSPQALVERIHSPNLLSVPDEDEDDSDHDNMLQQRLKAGRAKRFSRSSSRSSSIRLPLSRSGSSSSLHSPGSGALLSPYRNDGYLSSEFSCSEDDRSENEYDNDNYNENDHDGETPTIYVCETCGKEFNRPYNLKSHLRTHTNEKPYGCRQCGKRFARQHDRKRHEDLHSGEKRFQCRGTLNDPNVEWGCLKKFARTDALRRHFWTENGRNCIQPLVKEHTSNGEEINDEIAVKMAMENAINLMKRLNPNVKKPRERKSRR